MPSESGFPVHERAEVTSTQDEARALIAAGTPPPFAVRARVQTAGRGRRGRSWASPEGGLWLSVVLPVRPPADPFPGLLAALAALEAVAELLPSPAAERLALKWPNDLVVRGPGDEERKWGGVLGELDARPAATGPGGLAAGSHAFIIGVGLDLAVPAAALPGTEPPALPATSLLAEFGRSPSPDATLPRILERFGARLALDRSPEGRERSIAALTPHLTTLGRAVRWREGEAIATGRAVGLASDGGLVVEPEGAGGSAAGGSAAGGSAAGGTAAGGTRRVLRAGEVDHLRRTGGN